jgi:RNA polymerase sigma factor (sigma-70 family)
MIDNNTQTVLEKICRDASRGEYRKNIHIAQREPQLQEYFFQVSYLKLLEYIKKKNININNKENLTILKNRANFAIKDAIREEIVQMPRNRQDDLKVWLCPTCEKELHYKEQKHINAHFCNCGTKKNWTYDPYRNPLNFIKNATSFNKEESDILDTKESTENQMEKTEIKDQISFALRIDTISRTILEDAFLNEMQFIPIGKKFNRSDSWVSVKHKEALQKARKLAETIK